MTPACDSGEAAYNSARMALTAGTKLGPYEIQSPLGAGGMGEVYRARDTRLDRTVAIKILPEHLSQKAESKERFDREARAVSSLSHPHICSLFDVGRQDDISYLVMEYLEGETLAERLRKGPLSLDLVIRYGTDVCQGLEKAHRSGVVHRDLKPGNVMLTKTGAKLMDFGLAKSVALPHASSTGLTQTLTRAVEPLTGDGHVVGTFQYMSPEQVEGKDADARSDIFALGAVLYEMVTGQRAFEGKTTASTIAAILAAEPKPLSEVQPMTPPALDYAIRTCLVKDPDERWQSAADVARQLQWTSQSASQPGTSVARPAPRAQWIVVVVVGLAAVAGAFWLGSSRHTGTPQVMQFEITAPDKTYFNFRGFSGPPTPSPDGKTLAFVAYVQGQTSGRALWLRALNSTESHMVPGSEGATYPFWSPDGGSLGFFAEGKLKRFDLATSTLITLCEVAEGRGGAWSKDGVILFGNRADSLFRVEARGGKPVRFTALDPKRQEVSHRWPQFLPDQKHFLFVTQAPTNPPAHLFVASLDDAQGRVVNEELRYGVFSEGYLFYIQENDLLAQRFDPERLEFDGESTVLARQVQTDPQFNFAAFSVSGPILAYQTGGVAAGTRLMEFDRSGKETILRQETDLIESIALSPKGDQIAAGVGLSSGQLSDVWIYDLQKSSKARLTFDQHSFAPMWSPDGSKIVFSRQTESGSQLVIKSVSGGGVEQLVTTENQRTLPMTWTPDGRYLLYRLGLALAAEIKVVSPTGARKAVSLLTIKSAAYPADLSPDGRWLAYASSESGLQEVYVVPVRFTPEGAAIGDGKWQVTSGGSADPMWRADGKELFFVSNSFTGLGSARVNAVGEHFEVEAAQHLVDVGAHPVSRFYAPSRDGQKFYATTYGPGSTAPITVTLNWRVLLKK